MRVTLFLGGSLDGFVARDDDGLDFLGAGADGGPVAEAFAAFLRTVDVLVMGRRTFEVVQGFGPEAWPYGDTRLVVLSRRWRALPAGCRPSVALDAGEPGELLARLAAQGVGHVYVDGAATARAWLAAGCVTDLVYTVVPVLIGRGKTPWGPLPADRPLRLVGAEVLAGGAVMLRYEVAARS